MHVEYLSLCLICASFVLAPLTALMVGSQDRADARSIAGWLVGVFGLLLLTECAQLVPRRAEPPRGGLGFLVLYSSLIAAVGWGYQIAALRAIASGLDATGKKPKPDPWDDEIA